MSQKYNKTHARTYRKSSIFQSKWIIWPYGHSGLFLKVLNRDPQSHSGLSTSVLWRLTFACERFWNEGKMISGTSHTPKQHLSRQTKPSFSLLDCALRFSSDLSWHWIGWDGIDCGYWCRTRRMESNGLDSSAGQHRLGWSCRCIDDSQFSHHLGWGMRYAFFAFLRHFRFLMGILKVPRWFGLKILILKHLWKSKIRPLEQILG